MRPNVPSEHCGIASFANIVNSLLAQIGVASITEPRLEWWFVAATKREPGLSLHKLQELCRTKRASLELIRSSPPTAWPTQVAELLTKSVAVCPPHVDGEELRLIAVEAVDCLATLTGSRLGVNELAASLCGLLDHRAHDLSGRVEETVRTALGRVRPGTLVEGVQARRIVEYIDGHLHRRLTMVTLARASGWPERELARNFRNHVGVTIHGYIVRARVKRAMELLAQGDKASVVMNEVGYHNKTSFNRAFRRITGVTPGAFQKQLKP
jgi:AraC-like DNA-binding protein